MGFKVYQASLPDVAEVAKKLPLGRLYANGRGFVPNIRQSLYTDVVAAVAFGPETALSQNRGKTRLPPGRRPARSRGRIVTGAPALGPRSPAHGSHWPIVRERNYAAP